MKLIVERTFSDINYTCHGWSYQKFDELFKNLILEMRDKLGHPHIGDMYRNLRFFMNVPFYNEFCMRCKNKTSVLDTDMYRGIRIIEDPTLYVGKTAYPDGIVRLIYEEKSAVDFWCDQYKIRNAKRFSSAAPHIDHVIFNDPATIVFWKDGTKTVVKYDGKGRKDKRMAIMYAFMRKIYGEGRAYHDILNEIEEAIK